jgi:hypothetical protein
MEKILHHCGICSQYLLPSYVHLPEPHGLLMPFWCRVPWNVSTHFGRNLEPSSLLFFLAFFRHNVAVAVDYLMSVFFFMLGKVLEPQSYVIIVIVDFLVMFGFYFLKN